MQHTQKMQQHFASDNGAGACPQASAWLHKANDSGHEPAYGEDRCHPAEITWKAGVDVLCFGVIQNGLPVGKAAVDALLDAVKRACA